MGVECNALSPVELRDGGPFFWYSETRMVMLIVTFLAATLVALSSPGPKPVAAPDPLQPARAALDDARKTLADKFSVIDTRSGLAASLQERLDSDAPAIGKNEKPTWMSTADYVDYETQLAKLDKSLVDQYASGAYHALAEVRGADDTAFKSPADSTMQPLAVYVPKTYDPRTATSLVVFLHGNTCSENDPLALPWVRTAADTTNSIIIAPYARGNSQYVDPAPADVFAALDAALHAFNIDRRRIYLAGHSMGGYGVFIVGPKHPEDWAAVMAVSGGMTTETLNDALRGLQGIPVYMVVGSEDPIVPKGYMKRNVDLLQRSGIEAHYYEEPGGAHAIGTISKSYAQAWRDMLARTRRGILLDLPRATPMPGIPTPHSTRES
ncbi:MAG TPA: prolyl oligopeptidase family serine peptidase [Candidatus Acidoferrales bacterium]|nr:prolyl oligopeptidase family serine peptidase [Candidatus Acidoferrales bacterium]